MSKKDLETFEDDILNIIEGNLASKILLINDEKSDGITLDNIPREHWFDGANEKVFNLNAYAVYGFDDIEGMIPNEKAGVITYTFEIAFNEGMNTKSSKKKALRYGRILKEIIEENAYKLAYVSNLEMTLFAPISIKDIRENHLKVVGVQISTTMG